MKAHRATGSSAGWTQKFKVHNAYANTAEYSVLFTLDGKSRRLAVLRCSCGHQFWGRKQIAKAMERKGERLKCHDCFVAAGNKASPWYARRLNAKELEELDRWYEVQGVKVIRPS